jgi:hypothetical protein
VLAEAGLRADPGDPALAGTLDEGAALLASGIPTVDAVRLHVAAARHHLAAGRAEEAWRSIRVAAGLAGPEPSFHPYTIEAHAGIPEVCLALLEGGGAPGADPAELRATAAAGLRRLDRYGRAFPWPARGRGSASAPGRSSTAAAARRSDPGPAPCRPPSAWPCPGSWPGASSSWAATSPRASAARAGWTATPSWSRPPPGSRPWAAAGGRGRPWPGRAVGRLTGQPNWNRVTSVGKALQALARSGYSTQTPAAYAPSGGP